MQVTTCDKCSQEVSGWHTVELMGITRQFCQKCIIPVQKFMEGYCDPEKKQGVGFKTGA